jgi:hypothetical protein
MTVNNTQPDSLDELDEPTNIEPKSGESKPKMIEEKADVWQKTADAKVADALVAIPHTIHGVTLHPFTTARGSLLRRIGNEFVQGVKLDAITDPFLSVGNFLLIMSVTLPEARKLCVDPTTLENQAYDLLDTIKLADMPDVIKKVNAYVHEEMGNRVHGELPPVEGDTATPDVPKN